MTKNFDQMLLIQAHDETFTMLLDLGFEPDKAAEITDNAILSFWDEPITIPVQ